MTVFAVDTNILVYAADRHASDHVLCRNLLLEWTNGTAPWRLTWGVIYEFLRVVTHPRILRRTWALSESWRFVEVPLSSPGLRVRVETPRHAEITAQVFREAPDLCGSTLFDTHTAILMREHGVRRIVTRDADFRRFPFIEVVDPLA